MNRLQCNMNELQGYAVVFLLCLSCLLAGVDSEGVNLSKEEMDGLQALWKAWSINTPDPDSNLHNWRNSSHPCGYATSNDSYPDPIAWRGLTCHFHGDTNYTWVTGVTVTGLWMYTVVVSGVLPPSMSLLSNLDTIMLRGNNLSGPIPKEIMQLRRLNYVDMSRNIFTGQVPDVSSWQGNWAHLDLSNNKLTGHAPDVSLMSHLAFLDLSQNKITGQAPDVSGLSQLQHLGLSHNEFTGQAPNVSRLSQLTELDLSQNNFTGQAPDVSRLSQLYELDLSQNNFTGQAPNVSQLSQLQWLDLSQNNFTGQAPDVSQLSQLQDLDLSQNLFTGQAPDVSRLSNLYNLTISWNRFTGQAPNLSGLTILQYLDLSWNNFTSLPPEMFLTATSVEYVDFSNNNFSGPAPSLTNLSSLTYLNLSSNLFTNLSNNLVPFLNALQGTSLTVLDLSDIDIGGPVPDWDKISQLSMISKLYLDKNKFNGTLNISAFGESNISKALDVLSLTDNMITDVVTSDDLIIAGRAKIMLQGNPYCNKSWTSQDDLRRCTFYCVQRCNYTPKSNNSWMVIVMASSISSAVVVLVILGFAFILRRNQKYIRDLQKKIKDADINAKRFEYSELRVATKNFAPQMKLGAGAYGAVYKGILVNNLVVAVKQLFLDTDEGRDDFLNEVLLISNLQHRNLVALKGYCLHGKQTLLVYEYVDNCDLDKLLLSRHCSTDSTSDGSQPVLNWQARLNVCQGVAQGLYYLHASSQSRIIHRDIKASNILLDKNLQPKIADFGLARPIEDARSVILTQQCAGTLGYLAPEYMCHGQLSDKADVYSFGVLLLEIVSGKRNRDLTMPEDEVYLPNWAWKLHKESRLLDMKDPTLLVSEDEAMEVQRVLETAVSCVQNAPDKRPSMFLVAAMLAGKANVDAIPPNDEIHDIHDSWPGGIISDEFDCETPLSVSSLSGPASVGDPLTSGSATIELRSMQNAKLNAVAYMNKTL